MADISSAGIARMTPGYGKTCRKDVLRGVDVPVVPGTARLAGPRAHRERHRRCHAPARRTRLARWQPAVHHDQVTPGRAVPGPHEVDDLGTAVGTDRGRREVPVVQVLHDVGRRRIGQVDDDEAANPKRPGFSNVNESK